MLKISGFIRFVVNLEKMYFFITCRYNEDNSSVKDITDFFLPEYTLV